MQRHSIYNYYFFGTCLRYLQDAQEGHSIHREGCIFENIDTFLSYLGVIGLPVTERVSRELDNFRTDLSEADKDSFLSKEQAKTLQELMKKIRVTLEAELEGVEAFTTTPKRIDIQKLLDDVPNLFSPKVFNALPEIAQYDLSEGGKCIAFERATAAAFHILRGTEAVLRHFYNSLIRRSRVKSLNWGPIVQDLRKHRKTDKYITLINHLDNIRHSFRNPTAHPESIYDIHEVQDLWGVCADVINRMIKILNTLT